LTRIAEGSPLVTDRPDDHWARKDEAEEERPSTMRQLGQILRDEARDYAIDKAVNFASGGWLSYEGGDEDEEPQREQPAARDSFEMRLERALAELQTNGGTAPGAAPAASGPVPAPAPPPPLAPGMPGTASAAAAPAAYRPAMPAPRGFGRKGLL
jgi:hypothetical protein